MTKVECCFNTVPSFMTGRCHPFAHIIIPTCETLHLRLGETDYLLKEGHIAFVPPNTFHRVVCEQRVLWFNIPVATINDSDAAFFSRNPVFPVTEVLRPLIMLIKHEASLDLNSDALRYLFFYLYAKLASRSKLKSIQYMETHYAETIDIPTLAQMENYNPTYFIAWFKDKTGLTPNGYLNRLRTDKAKELLINTQYRIIDIALQTGYANGSSFARAFKKTAGISPREYRNRHGVTGRSSKPSYRPDA